MGFFVIFAFGCGLWATLQTSVIHARAPPFVACFHSTIRKNNNSPKEICKKTSDLLKFIKIFIILQWSTKWCGGDSGPRAVPIHRRQIATLTFHIQVKIYFKTSRF